MERPITCCKQIQVNYSFGGFGSSSSSVCACALLSVVKSAAFSAIRAASSGCFLLTSPPSFLSFFLPSPHRQTDLGVQIMAGLLVSVNLYSTLLPTQYSQKHSYCLLWYIEGAACSMLMNILPGIIVCADPM